MRSIPSYTARWLLRRAREEWDKRGYIPHALAKELSKYGYTKPELELQFALGAQA